MRNRALYLIAVVAFLGCATKQPALKPIPDSKLTLRADTLESGLFSEASTTRTRLLAAIDESIRYTRSKRARVGFERSNRIPISPSQVEQSLSQFKALVQNSRNADEFVESLLREFRFLAVENGKSLLTAYYRPQLHGSRERTDVFRYPLFRLPSPDDGKVKQTRLELEGADGLQYEESVLHSCAIVFLENRLDAFLAQTQGSAEVKLEDGKVIHLGFSGGTDFPYTSIGAELIAAGKIPPKGVDIEVIKNHFMQHPEDLNIFLPRNDRFVFFKEMSQPSSGNLGFPVIEGRSLAMDQSIFPPGALALIGGMLPNTVGTGTEFVREWRFGLVHDSGSAIKGPRRADMFLGAGSRVGDIAGKTKQEVTIIFPLLKDEALNR